MLMNWRDQADLIIWSVWDFPVVTVISRRILAEVSIVSNKGGHRTYGFGTGMEVMIIKGIAVFL